MKNIRDVLDSNSLKIHLQPILSLRGRTIFGVEALVRGVNPDGTLLSPDWLFAQASEADCIAELDQQARQLSINAFLPLWKENPKLFLFINLESSAIDNFQPERYLFDGLLRSLGIPFENIVLEIKENKIKNTLKLKEFCSHYRDLGFHIALDDFGIGESSFDRLSVVRPDIIKIDRSLMENIQNNYIHQEIVQAICKMSNKLGALALAEGVETLQESMYAKYLGATLIQGFFFAKASINPFHSGLVTKVDLVKLQSQQMLLDKYRSNERLKKRAESLNDTFCDVVSKIDDTTEWAEHFEKHLEHYPDVEAIYLLDSNAKQISETLLRCATRSFFEPTVAGCDHSYKDYYLRAKDSLHGDYLTDNYLSLASGSICFTYSSVIAIRDETLILCIDFVQQ